MVSKTFLKIIHSIDICISDLFVKKILNSNLFGLIKYANGKTFAMITYYR